MINLGEELNHYVELSHLDENSVVVDAGANIGKFVTALRSHIDCKIISIECSKNNLLHLKNVQQNNLIILENALVGNKRNVTMSEFVGQKKQDGTNKYHQWNNIYGNHENKGLDATVNHYEVEGITLAEVLSLAGGKVDYLKMDIEGAEYEVVESMTQEQADNIPQISMELHDSSKNKQLSEKLQSLGYSLHWMPYDELYATKL